MTFGRKVAAFERALGSRHGLEFLLVDKYIVMFEAPEAALLRGSQFSPPGEFDHIVGAAVQDVGHVFGAKQVVLLRGHRLLSSEKLKRVCAVLTQPCLYESGDAIPVPGPVSGGGKIYRERARKKYV